MKRIIFMFPAWLLVLATLSCGNKQVGAAQHSGSVNPQAAVTFIELGSVNCMPCKMMIPVMQAVKDRYKDQVNVVFYDVWTPEEQYYGQYYRIRAIPTQVFLDKEGREFFRHEGYFPLEELELVLQKRGLQPKLALQ